MTILPAESADIGKIITLNRQGGLEEWDRESWQSYIGDVHRDLELAQAGAGREPLGFFLGLQSGPDYELLKIAVATGFRREGVGTALLERSLDRAVERGCSGCFLEVRAEDRRAVGFYLKNQFKIQYRRIGYYRNPVGDALVMSRPLVSGVGRDRAE